MRKRLEEGEMARSNTGASVRRRLRRTTEAIRLAVLLALELSSNQATPWPEEVAGCARDQKLR
jgi:hypothetical protein